MLVGGFNELKSQFGQSVSAWNFGGNCSDQRYELIKLFLPWRFKITHYTPWKINRFSAISAKAVVGLECINKKKEDGQIPTYVQILDL
jgi:hypothetical protein